MADIDTGTLRRVARAYNLDALSKAADALDAAYERIAELEDAFDTKLVETLAEIRASAHEMVVGRVEREISRLRPHYQHKTAINAGRIQILDHLSEFLAAPPSRSLLNKEEENG